MRSLPETIRRLQRYRFVPLLFAVTQLIICSISSGYLHADVVTFGSGASTFTLDFKAVGNPNNAADTSWQPSGLNQLGTVGYSFGMSQVEITERMIDVYNSDPLNVASPITYSSPARGADRPATGVTWNEAARFVNWLNRSKSNGSIVAYRTTTAAGNISLWSSTSPSQALDYNSSNPYRSKRALYALATLNEWYKAAYYDPTKNGGIGGYWDYSVRTNSAPNPVSSGVGATDVVYGLGSTGVPASVYNSGGLSTYGVRAMNGNVWEWTETPMNASYSGSATRYVVGGGFADVDPTTFNKDELRLRSPSQDTNQIGFRVISLVAEDFDDGGGMLSGFSSVPEPSVSFVYVVAMGGFGWRLRRKQQLVRPSAAN
ncbi:MAG: hypothetical protein RLZZ458_2756 [Planctomycetota bacterium]|jgi:formylglycine-generating enzyme required for sulfatase activity